MGSVPSMRKRLIPLIAIAFVVAVISTAVFYSLFAGRLSASATPEVPTRKIVVAAHDMAPGGVLSQADLQVVPWPSGAMPKGAYETAAAALGKTVFSGMLQGEPVLESRLASKDGTGSGVPAGMRAVSVHVSDSSGVVGMLKPGYKVDVQVFSSRSSGKAKEEVRTILRGITVLSANPQPEASSQGYFAAPVVTLLAQAHDAEELAQADSYSRLRLTLRNPLEELPAETRPPVAAAAPAAPPASDKPAYEGLYRIKAVELTDEGLAAFAGRLDARIGARDLTVIATSADPGSVNELVRSTGARAVPDTVVTAAYRRWSIYEVPREGTEVTERVRLLVSPSAAGREVRIHPEVTGVWNGRTETRSVETQLGAAPGRVIVIGGLGSGDPRKTERKFRHLLLIVVPEAQAPVKTAG
jgi:pilus assembly protein CpaB